ncbi:Ig-like domain-containing protein [Snuella sp. CAU 1569]|uniref:Ig-like domain-containing protein n=2 Tax=Snuella sedimenti TaxID=2798802 RepID=A0A8J7IIT0_9FLAO|nr:Ig-like domain-containing domain [Snuella sedimenti]MBJ6369106.1 Ig-like domain-containing protein [Snuella sedimenti]
MHKVLSNFILVVFIGLIIVSCANRGSPDGGPKDETPPVIVKSVPENYSTQFKAKEIKVYFDEFVKIKDLQKQLIISPPMKTQPEITPLGSASKFITIKIFDTLQPNTTYAFNFGNSITDNNEGNPFPYYRYVFSTGDYIDSLTVKGQIVDALKRKPETFVSVALYEVDSTFNDSIIYKEVPKYITNTLDSVTTFSIENVKAGKYMLMALKDGNGDNKFQQKTDQIGFHNTFIEVPTDSLYTLKLFNEDIDFKPVRPRLFSGEKIAFGYEGDHSDVKITMTSEVPDDFDYRITKDEKADTLYYWYKPRLEVDSLLFTVSHPTVKKDFTVRISEQPRDSLTLKSFPSGNIGYDEPFKIFGSVPFVNFDPSKVTIIDKDSLNVDFTTTFDTITNAYAFNFKKVEDNNYKIQVLPEAFTDFFDDKNDTLNYSVKTKRESDYSKLRIILKNAVYPVIVQLTTEKGEIKYEQYASENKVFDFLTVDPGKYYARVVFDSNGNQKHDTGNYLKKQQPERVSNFELDDDMRSDWDTQQILELIPQ